jgi:NTP pyrophosphatase (non-canonical NTP hydrolase)
VDDVSDLTSLQNAIRDFADRREWQQFHTPKNLAMAICGEAGELAAEFQWLTPEESSSLSPEQLEAVRLEIADVAIYLLRCADVLGVDVVTAVHDKLAINEARFEEA